MDTFPERSPSLNFRSPNVKLIVFSFIIFIYSFGDAIMSYVAPNSIEKYIQNTFLMGLIFSTSSVVGFIADYLLGNVIKEKTFVKYIFVGLVLAIIFPLMLLKSPTSIVYLVIAMGVWGLYYEFILFGKSNFIHRYLSHDKHDIGWTITNAFMNIAYLIGPSAAVFLFALDERLPLYIAIVLAVISIGCVLIFKISFGNQHQHLYQLQRKPKFSAGFASWKILSKRLWPILFFMFSLTLIDATVWTIGAIMVATNQNSHPLISLFYVFVMLPGIVMSPIGIKISGIIGKKRTAFAGGLLCGLSYMGILINNDVNVFLCLVGLGSVGFYIALPEIRGVIEDYCERLGESANSLVGLMSSMGSLGYVVGPILSGGIAVFIGNQNTFAVMGIGVFIASLAALLIVPRKIRLPQTELKTMFD